MRGKTWKQGDYCKEGKLASDVNSQDSVDLLFTAETF